MHLTATVLHAFKRRWLLAFGPRHPAPATHPAVTDPVAWGESVGRDVLRLDSDEAFKVLMSEERRAELAEIERRVFGGGS